uniref:Uncharacterized protein n=1 Tax=Echinococcus granulosus TaxID=6210 RepID=A0A068WVJ3_ECHGR|nr:hypothetical protein EgrG_002046500 [Echinococcus granulosus]
MAYGVLEWKCILQPTETEVSVSAFKDTVAKEEMQSSEAEVSETMEAYRRQDMDIQLVYSDVTSSIFSSASTKSTVYADAHEVTLAEACQRSFDWLWTRVMASTFLHLPHWTTHPIQEDRHEGSVISRSSVASAARKFDGWCGWLVGGSLCSTNCVVIADTGGVTLNLRRCIFTEGDWPPGHGSRLLVQLGVE